MLIFDSRITEEAAENRVSSRPRYQAFGFFKPLALAALCALLYHTEPSVAVTNPKTKTTTTLKSSSTSIKYGTSLTLTAMVSPQRATGTVNFYSGKTELGKATLLSGSAKLSLPAVNAGLHEISAVYQGSATYAESTSKTETVRVDKAATSITISSSAKSGKTVTLTAKVTPVNVTGVVEFLVGGSQYPLQIGDVILDHGIAKLPTPSGIPTGSEPFRATYLGDADWETSTSKPVDVTIQP
jgi:hypothetical protein